MERDRRLRACPCGPRAARTFFVRIARHPSWNTNRHSFHLRVCRMDRGLVPFCDSVTLKFPKPKHGYPLKVRTIGDHLKKRRLDLGLLQKQAARELGTNQWSLRSWEQGRMIRIRFYPAIIRFLGYNPLPESTTQGQLIRRERYTRGWSRRQLARVAGVDEGTIHRLEKDRKGMAKKPAQAVCKALGFTTESNKTGDK